MRVLQTSITCLKQEVKRRAEEVAMTMKEKRGVAGMYNKDTADHEVANQMEEKYMHSLVTALSMLTN